MAIQRELNKNICYIFQDQYPWDVRVEKITEALAEGGCKVHIISRNRDGLPLSEQYRENIFIHRISNGASRIKRNLKNFPAFFSPFWIHRILDIVKDNCINLIIVRDLPLSPAAYIVSELTDVPVIMDMAENYPALIKSTWKFRGPLFTDVLIRNPYLLSLMEKCMLPLLDGVIVVSELSASRIRNIRRKKDRVWVVSNTPQLDKYQEGATDHILVEKLRNRSTLIILYVGFIEPHRGLDIPVRAMPELVEIYPDILFTIIGDGAYKNDLEQLALKLGIQKNVVFTGWIPHQQVPSLIKIADICLIPHFVTEHTDTTYPNKIFDYMAQKKPVVVTQSRALSEIIHRSKCGIVYNDQSTFSFIQAIRSFADVNLRNSAGLNGWNAVKKLYNWDIDKVKLLQIVLKLVA